MLPDRSGEAGTDLRAALATAATRLREAGIERPMAEARLLAGKVTGLDRAALLAASTTSIDPGAASELERLVERRCGGEPMAYILGHREFWGLDFAVGPGVLIPRPESETLIEAVLPVLADRPAARLVDFGTGSGCLLLSLLHEAPGAFGVGVDRSADALAFAAANARRLGLADRAAFVRASWGSALFGPFDVIIANPPYITDAERARLDPGIAGFEPELALYAADEGLAAYREIIDDSLSLLAEDGVLALEIGDGREQGLLELLDAAGFDAVTHPDLAGTPRCALARK